MPKIAVEVDLRQIEQIISQLRTEDRISLVQRLEQTTWRERLRNLTAQIDKRRKKYPISQKEIMRLVKEARQERYAAQRHPFDERFQKSSDFIPQGFLVRTSKLEP